jgi:AcrR family transcriptional regulator
VPLPVRADPSNGGGPSLARIFEGTLAALSRRGAKQLSMTDVCEAAGISRATLYRYFAKKDELLAALGEHVTNNFVLGVKEAAATEQAPQEKLRAVLRFMTSFTREVKSDRILEVEPGFVIESLQAQFPRHLAALSAALDPVFDAIDERIGRALDRGFVCELLLRAQESTSLIPAGARWDSLPDLLAQFAMVFLEQPRTRAPRRSVAKTTPVTGSRAASR